MRRALDIYEAAFGKQNPARATIQHNLATLLKNTNRIEEAEPLMQRSLDTFECFGRQTGHEHPYFQRANKSYQALQGDGHASRCVSRIDRQRRQRTPSVD